jgi:hypothetical protein
MNKWLVVSFYTSNYADIAHKYLIPSLIKLNLDYRIIEVLNLNSWKEATDYKAIYIRNCLYQFTCDIVWIDCDATVNEYPKLFDELSESNVDIAYHMLSWESHYGRPRDKGRLEFLSGTLYFKNNDKTKQLVDKWIENTKIYSPEQKALHKSLIDSNNIYFYELPREYCYITTKPNGELPAVLLKNPIISHFQASRGVNKCK